MLEAGDTKFARQALEPLPALRAMRTFPEQPFSKLGLAAPESGGSGALSPMFGVYAAFSREGEQGVIRVGDPVVLIE